MQKCFELFRVVAEGYFELLPLVLRQPSQVTGSCSIENAPVRQGVDWPGVQQRAESILLVFDRFIKCRNFQQLRGMVLTPHRRDFLLQVALPVKPVTHNREEREDRRDAQGGEDGTFAQDRRNASHLFGTWALGAVKHCRGMLITICGNFAEISEEV